MLDLTGIFPDITDFIAIATFMITALVSFWGIRFTLRLLNSDGGGKSGSESFSDYGYVNDSGYQQWLSTKSGASNSIRGRWDDNYQDYLNHKGGYN